MAQSTDSSRHDWELAEKDAMSGKDLAIRIAIALGILIVGYLAINSP